jgi:hypothetical protein
MAESKAFLDGWHVQDNTDQPLGQLRVDGDDGCICIVGTSRGIPTPLAERHEMAALIAAAPAMLALLKRGVDVVWEDNDRCEEWVRAVRAVLARAEPVRRVKRAVEVRVLVEVEADADAHPEAIRNAAFDSVYASCGAGVEFKSKVATTIGELYED